MEVVIDRFEGAFAIAELPDGTHAELARILLPDAAEGDVVEITVNREKTEENAREIKKLMDAVWEE